MIWCVKGNVIKLSNFHAKENIRKDAKKENFVPLLTLREK